MIVENPAALQFIINEQIYLSKSDANKLSQQGEGVAVTDIPVTTQSAVSQQPAATIPADAETAPIIQTPVLNFNYLGNNAGGFLIICHYPGLDMMDEKHLAALTSTLQRKQLALTDVALVNIALYADATVEQLQLFFKPQRLLLLGAQCRLPGWEALPLNKLTSHNGYTALYTYGFAEMMGDRDKTKAFWEEMKQL